MGWTDVDESREVATWGERKAVIIPGSRSPQTGQSVARVHRDGATGRAASVTPAGQPRAGAAAGGRGAAARSVLARRRFP
ncbi:hypothetical protein BCCH1_49200 [Burkholderia contaminans]|jgi:hypothetical protein|uniref:Uncharacterized protein n=1 Tax=Burkholderia contaminans TaxID=488447 RepID=A0A250LCY9_9BURK|nr:hypothetical protein [Burkholderia contaminans]BBA42445.1 hypothetical protein BCCH1_49200 [Burkholderia contaminans]GLZ68673.1 hypothetical protein Bcon01_17180 [Burkholderia contaminans]